MPAFIPGSNALIGDGIERNPDLVYVADRCDARTIKAIGSALTADLPDGSAPSITHNAIDYDVFQPVYRAYLQARVDGGDLPRIP